MRFWKHPAMPMVLLLMLFVAIVVAVVAGIVMLKQPRREAPIRIGHQVVNPSVPGEPDSG